MKVLVCIVSFAYGLLSVVAPLAQMKAGEKRPSNLVMLCGGVLLMVAAGLKWFAVPASVYVAALGAVAICAAALWNGAQNGKIHIRHHVVRIAVSVGIIVLFVLA